MLGSVLPEAFEDALFSQRLMGSDGRAAAGGNRKTLDPRIQAGEGKSGLASVRGLPNLPYPRRGGAFIALLQCGFGIHTLTPPMTPRKILVTNALPYANGDIHLGHLVGYIQADIWVRFQRMRGNTVHYVCADDTHGTPVMLRGREGRPHAASSSSTACTASTCATSPASAWPSTTTTPPTAPRTASYAQRHLPRPASGDGLIDSAHHRAVLRPRVKEMFLPDRFIKGECPEVRRQADQYGDNCEVLRRGLRPDRAEEPLLRGVGRHAGAADLASTTSSASRDPRASTSCANWTRAPRRRQRRLQPEAAQQDEGVAGRGRREQACATGTSRRDAPYFGFEIPEAAGQVFLRLAGRADRLPGQLRTSLQERLGKIERRTSPTPLTPPTPAPSMVHFIGKDILYFHALFWPAMLHFAGYRTPTQLCVQRLPDRERRRR